MYYANQDYIARMIKDEETGIITYSIRFHSQPEIEVDYETFTLYTTEFRKPFDNRRWEQRKHIDFRSLDELATEDSVMPWDQIETQFDIDSVLKTCTPTQQRRFKMYLAGHSFVKIAELENGTRQGVTKSVEIIKEKIKKYFST